ncbi:hypothetical protein [Bradyrhizobium sp. USDA 3458]|nr:hypothetical protein [Bradyrhizobium sp. USDA 3458]
MAAAVSAASTLRVVLDCDVCSAGLGDVGAGTDGMALLGAGGF